MRVRRLLLLGIVGLAVVLGQPDRVWAQGTGALPEWPAVTREARPWTRWWWLGNAVNEAELTAALEAYREVGIGGVEITPIYGVAGYEDRFIEFLSDDWMRVLVHTLKEAARLDLGVDMATGTGWPFGGPWVSQEDASRYVVRKVYRLRGGGSRSRSATTRCRWCGRWATTSTTRRRVRIVRGRARVWTSGSS